MHDLRWDQHDAAVTHVVHVLPAESLRTVPMPDLRSADARTLDAAARDLRTVGERVDDELGALRADNAALREAIERIADAVQVLILRLDDGK